MKVLYPTILLTALSLTACTDEDVTITANDLGSGELDVALVDGRTYHLTPRDGAFATDRITLGSHYELEKIVGPLLGIDAIDRRVVTVRAFHEAGELGFEAFDEPYIPEGAVALQTCSGACGSTGGGGRCLVHHIDDDGEWVCTEYGASTQTGP